MGLVRHNNYCKNKTRVGLYIIQRNHRSSIDCPTFYIKIKFKCSEIIHAISGWEAKPFHFYCISGVAKARSRSLRLKPGLIPQQQIAIIFITTTLAISRIGLEYHFQGSYTTSGTIIYYWGVLRTRVVQPDGGSQYKVSVYHFCSTYIHVFHHCGGISVILAQLILGGSMKWFRFRVSGLVYSESHFLVSPKPGLFHDF